MTSILEKRLIVVARLFAGYFVIFFIATNPNIVLATVHINLSTFA